MGPIARLERPKRPSANELVQCLRLAETVISQYLDSECEEFRNWDTPRYRLVGPLPATGAFSRKYLENVLPPTPDQLYRIERLKRFADTNVSKAVYISLVWI